MVVSWTLDSTRVIFLSHRATPVRKLVRAFSVPVTGGMAEPLPLDRAGRMSFAPNGHQIAFNRTFRNLELRKRYVGGQQQDIYTYDFDARVLKRLTTWKGTDTSPMWFGRKIYFVSDRDAHFRQNIWSLDLDTHSVRQISTFTDYDVDWPSLAAQTIVFQQGGHLWAIDLPSERLRKVDVTYADLQQPKVGAEAVGKFARVTDAMNHIDYASSPRGDSLLLSARGDLFRLDRASHAEDLTNTPGVEEDHPSWSPDGRMIAYETDRDGSQQLAVQAATGGPGRLLTHYTSGYFYTPLWSPRNDSFVVADAAHSLWWVRLDGSNPQKIGFDPHSEIRDASFSPDGRWVAYSTERSSQLRAIHLHELATGSDTVVSSPMESDRLPVFSPDGQYLIFVSQRYEQAYVSDRDDENLISTVNSDGLYAVTLQRYGRPLGAVTTTSHPASAGAVTIDFKGLMSRAVALPMIPSTIVSLQVSQSALLYQVAPIQLISGDLAGGKAALHAMSLTSLQDRTLAEGLDNFDLSSDGLRIVFHRQGKWYSTGVGEEPGSEVQIRCDAMTSVVDQSREWSEMFESAWRLDRDVFFSKAMNGSNWAAVHDAYAKLLPFVSSHDDFVYLLQQMQGEIASSHTFIDPRDEDDVTGAMRTGLLGADYAMDVTSGRYRFEKIYSGDRTRPAMQSPLSKPGLDVKEGDYLLAVNGRELKMPLEPDELLAGITTEVTLSIASDLYGPRRNVRVVPLTDDMRLRRHDWIEHNRAEVDRLSNGRLGYIFVTDFGAEGEADFVRQFYPQREKDGLIFDVRWNGGGFTSQSVLDVLRREIAGVFVNREGALSTLPTAVGPRALVALANYASASDGDQFPYFFKQFHLGKVVGERTWGGVQGINRDWTLTDGTSFTIPKDALASVQGQWIIENTGTEPDIAVSSAPDERVFGKDRQLETAIAVAMNELKAKPPVKLRAPRPLPAYPLAGEVAGASFSSN